MKLGTQHICFFVLVALVLIAPSAVADGSHTHHHTQHPSEDEVIEGTPPATDSIYWLAGTWTTDAGTHIELKDLRGSPVVLTLVYLSCKQACPILTEDLKRTYAALTLPERKQTRFVVVTLDPARDDLAAMRTYKRKIREAEGWTVLRGSPKQVMELAAVLGVRYRRVGDDFIHTNKISVLDREGRILHQATGLRAPIEDTVAAIHEALHH